MSMECAYDGDTPWTWPDGDLQEHHWMSHPRYGPDVWLSGWTIPCSVCTRPTRWRVQDFFVCSDRCLLCLKLQGVL